MAKFGGAQVNAGRKCAYEEQYRTALVNKNWRFLDEAFDKGTKKVRFTIAKMIMPVMVKTVPQVTINTNTNVDSVSFSPEDRAMVQTLLENLKNELKQ